MPEAWYRFKREKVAEGLSVGQAARIWNAAHPDEPVGRHQREPVKRRPGLVERLRHRRLAREGRARSRG